MNLRTSAAPDLAARTDALRRCFESIGVTRMHGVPVMNRALSVEAIGFEPCTGSAGDGTDGALGILLTPWFMNLIWLAPHGQAASPQGQSHARRLGGKRFDFIGAHEAGFGSYDMCSLFSPMFEFADQAAARATAAEVLLVLRRAERQIAARLASEPKPGRRGFLLGRVAPGPRP
ncbi:MAG: [NiFe]-hydrogenase assembly chaperone HybE [Pseudomonadota bacterium]|nr:[NiFe]-hydrogenase assembly chaperone HybE [Pseudomonadota bacterium]